MKLLSVNSDAKTSKGSTQGYLTGILYLAPSDEANGKRNVCPHASEGCRSACLFSAGRGKFSNVKSARVNKTLRFFDAPKDFIEILEKDIVSLIRKADKLGLTPCVRLNGTSDLPWENLGGQKGINLMNRFPHIQFYDYTKNPQRAKLYAIGAMPSNYHLTFSKSECNDKEVRQVLKLGGNVAMVFNTKKADELPSDHIKHEVIDGDISDVRFNDPKGVIVGLRAKGDAKKDTSGFVIQSVA
jgi:hypothetical protein